MRLGQLARKIGKRSAQIVAFLEEKNISINPDSNTRLEDIHVALVMERFAPDEMITQPEEYAPEQAPVELPSPEPEPVAETTPGETASDTNETPAETPEVIRAPKVELSGLKVLGKIDLPEPKKKEKPADTAGEESGAERKKFKGRDERSKQPRKNYLAQQREREAKEEQKKREREAEQKKAARRQFYETNAKVTRPVKTKPEKEAPAQAPEIQPEEPKTILKKFMRWLRPEY